MPTKTTKYVFYYVTGKTIYHCLWDESLSAYGDPSAGTGTYVLLIEGAATVYEGNVYAGKYRIVEEAPVGVYTTLYDDKFVGSVDLVNHINDADADMRHTTEAIKIPAADQGRLGTTLDAALNYITGAAWDKDSDANLKGHLDDTTNAHAGTAIGFTPAVGADWDVVPATVEAALDELGDRVRDLETGTAAAPSGIDDFLDSLGVVVKWDAQDVHDIQYAIKYLWKHTSESPALIGDLTHQRRTLAVEELITYFSRRLDLSSSPDSNLILYYAIAARGRADADWTWSAVQSIEVDLPEYTQEFRASLGGITLCCNGASGATSELFEAVREPNQFPTADATPPTENYYVVPACANNYQYTEITLHAAVLPDGDVSLILRNGTTGAVKSFTIDSGTGRIAVADQSFLLQVNSGAELQIYTLDAKNMGDVHLWLKRTLYTA